MTTDTPDTHLQYRIDLDDLQFLRLPVSEVLDWLKSNSIGVDSWDMTTEHQGRNSAFRFSFANPQDLIAFRLRFGV